MESWFVYLYALADCSAFKVGFTCHPLQRISTFSRRYFERFDLPQSLLLQLDDEPGARALESILKTELAAFRAEAPPWVPPEAGGHTEWFGAVYFGQAEARLRAAAEEASRVLCAFDYVRAELGRSRSSFESWAWRQSQQALELRAAAHRGYRVADGAASLRDWLDAYSYFDLQLFADDPAVRAFVLQSARS